MMDGLEPEDLLAVSDLTLGTKVAVSRVHKTEESTWVMAEVVAVRRFSDGRQVSVVLESGGKRLAVVTSVEMLFPASIRAAKFLARHGLFAKAKALQVSA